MNHLPPVRPRRRRAAALTANVLLAALAGCQTATPRPAKDAAPTRPALGGVQSTSAKTDFRSEVGPEQSFNVHLELGRVFESQGSFEAAVAEYQKAAEVCGKKGSALPGAKLGPAQHALAERRTAGAFDRLGRFTQAEVHYRKAMALAPSDAKVWNDVGYSYYLQNRFADAERALKTADSMDPNNPRVLTNLGLALAASGKTDDALQALSRSGGPAVGHANLGYILAAMGKAEEAKAHYRSALEIQPDLAAPRDALARLEKATPNVETVASAATPAPAPATAAAPPPPVATRTAEPFVIPASATMVTPTPKPAAPPVVTAPKPMPMPPVPAPAPTPPPTAAPTPAPPAVPAAAAVAPTPEPVAVKPKVAELPLVELPTAPTLAATPEQPTVVLPLAEAAAPAPKPAPAVAAAPTPKVAAPAKPAAPAPNLAAMNLPELPEELKLAPLEGPGAPKPAPAAAVKVANSNAPKRDPEVSRTSGTTPVEGETPSNPSPRTPW